MNTEKIKYVIIKANEFTRTTRYDEEEYFRTFAPTAFGYKEATKEEFEVIQKKLDDINKILCYLNITQYRYILISDVTEFDLDKELEKHAVEYNKILEKEKKEEERRRKNNEKMEKERAIKRKKYLEKKAEKLKLQLKELEENNKNS